MERFLEGEVRGFGAAGNHSSMNRFRRRDVDTVVEEGPPVVEEEELAPPPPPPRPPLLWPWLLLLLVLVLGGLAAAWLLTRDDNSTNPSPITGSSIQAEVVPNVLGEPAPAAVKALGEAGFRARRRNVASREKTGTVVAQSPKPGVKSERGSTVTINVSRGLVTVPKTIGQTRDAAVAALRDAGFVPRAFTVPSSQPKGTVVSQRPSAGLRAPAGSTVRLNVSNGAGPGAAPPPPPPPPPPAPPATVTVRDVTGQLQNVAQRQLNAAGRKAGVVYLESDEPQGTVVSQAPADGATRARGTRIQLNVALGPRPGQLKGVPDVRNLDPAAARAKLTAAGFTVQTLLQPVSDRSQVGKVVDEQPRGRNAPVRSVVTIYVGRST
jgi:eukaryotic-like serine/threonine-protein kinase